MEENTESHMETDVSSTTEDIPESQEVTGSDGNVEMIIVVEKMDEEETSTTDQIEERLLASPVDDNNTNDGSIPGDMSPLKVIEIQNSPTNSPETVVDDPKSPINYSQIVIGHANTPLKSSKNIDEITQSTLIVSDKTVSDLPKSPIKQLKRDCEAKSRIEPFKIDSDVSKSPIKAQTTGMEVLDSNKSSNKCFEVSKSPKSLCNVKSQKNSPNKVEDVIKEPQKDLKLGETKIQSLSKATSSSNTQQVEIPDSSVNEVPSTPIENKQTQDIQLSPKNNVQKPIQKTPTKEKQDTARLISTQELVMTEKVIKINGQVQTNDNNKLDVSNSQNISTIIPINITIEKEASNDSQNDILSDASEKELNKSISRELKSLINSAKESKIISECTQLTSKTRKSRVALDTSNSSLNSSLTEPNKIQDVRRNSDNSLKSNCSEKSEKIPLKRSMRSQNPEFVSKVKQFLNSVTGKTHKEYEEDEVDDKDNKIDQNDSLSKGTPPKVKKTEPTIVVEKSNKLRLDPFCWRCHWAVEPATSEKAHAPMQCTVCPRSFHFKCLTGSERNKINLEKSWVCPECMLVLQAESSETRSQSMKKISLSMLCDLLKHALERMMDLNGVEPFLQPVDRAEFPDYDKYVVHPMDLSLMKNNIAEGLYGSTEAFLADAQWILHNSIIFNTLQSKLTAGARALVRSCRAEMGEIEACPECYAAAHARRPTWFTDVCTTPHILLWAKLKGFPYWPAKGMSVNSSCLVDVRFFGAHDRAWVPAKDCFLFSEKDPNNFRTKRQDILDSMQEAEQHIRNISKKYGKFVYPPFKTQFEPSKVNEHLIQMIPSFQGELKSLVKEKSSPATKEKARTNSKSSKTSLNDGYVSESEETNNVKSRKMADGAEIAKMEEDESVQEKDVIINVETTPKKTREELPSSTTSASRKRRHSVFEEAVVTIIETSGTQNSTSEKRKKVEDIRENIQPQPRESIANKTDDKELSSDKSKDEPNEASKANAVTPTKAKDDLSTPIEKDRNQRVTPIRIALVTKDRRKTRNSISKEATAKIIPNTKDSENITPLRPKSSRLEKADKTPSKIEKTEKSLKTEKIDKTLKSDKTEKAPKSGAEKGGIKNEKVEKTPTPKTDKSQSSKNDKAEKSVDRTSKDERSRSEKRRNSRNSLNTSSITRSEKKSDKTPETRSKDKTKDSTPTTKQKEGEVDMARVEKQMSPRPAVELPSSKSVKDRLQFDDDTTLAVIARETKGVILSNNPTGFPTISSVRSLSTTAQVTSTTITKTTTNTKTSEATVTNNAKKTYDATAQLQKLRNDAETAVGRVGVRAFARMTSPDKSRKDNMEVEIKAEPLEIDDADRHMEKMDLMNAFRLRPVNPTPPSNLREVRINKVVVTPINAQKAAPTKTPEVRPRAKKSFPQPKKPDEGRSELNSKNSMVYIPIQPPMTQAPVRPPRPLMAAPAAPAPCAPPAPPTPRATAPLTTVSVNSILNTVTTPLIQVSSTCPSTTSSVVTSSSSIAPVANVPTVHTVPLMTSVNGQWMFSFQPVMSVGAIDNSPSPPILNGIGERGVSVPTGSTLSTPGIRTENAPGEPPRLQQRPTQLMNPLDSNTPIGCLPTPSTAGPVTAKLNQNAVKLTDFFRTLLEDSLEKLDEPIAQVAKLRIQLEQTQWQHKQEIHELKHNHELTLAEMRTSFEKERLRVVSETRRVAQVELEAAVKQAKSKQWCANCSQEAQFYCCWNTSYCNHACQCAHWSIHYTVCQQRSQSSNGEPPKSPENRLQPQPELPVLQKNSTSTTLTVGGKVAPRPSKQDSNNTQKSSIILSMVEDNSGNQSVKCLGTYKPTTNTQIAPIIINKQMLNNEESNKKVVTSSGGYLIVGSANSSTVATPASRTHAIQYYT